MITDRFKILRRNHLKKVFTLKGLVKTWRDITKTQLRSLDIRDMYDYYDFNYYIEERTRTIRNNILNGVYRAQTPLVYQVEKKVGIGRHINIPQPSDALILQRIAESINQKIINKQPSKNAFYSRDRHNVKNPGNFQSNDYEDIAEQWKRFQKEIYKFNKKKNYIVVTDLSNYYDSIQLKELRNIISSTIKIDEVLLDLLFRIIESLSWNPDYLPYTGQGLPTINLEALRLLAHVQLFEVDEILKNYTKNNFVRWMDDITFGVDSVEEGKKVLNKVSEVLKSRGLALNLSKTDIYDFDKAQYQFMIDENQYIDKVKIPKLGSIRYKSAEKDLYTRFKKVLKDNKPKAWSKVVKRYLTLFKRLKSDIILKDLEKLYLDYPSLRVHILYYLNDLGYSLKRSRLLLKIISGLDSFDNISKYILCDVITKWNIPTNKTGRSFIKDFLTNNFNLSDRFEFYCYLWVLTKYGSNNQLYRFIVKYGNKWENDSFLKRQVTATYSRLYNTHKVEIEKIIDRDLASGVLDTISLVNTIRKLSNVGRLDMKLKGYLLGSKGKITYTLPRFLVLCTVLNSSAIRGNANFVKQIKSVVHDDHYSKILKHSYNI